MNAIGSARARHAGRLASSLLAACAAFACGEASKPDAASAPPSGGVVLARVGDEVITSDDLGAIPPRAIAANRLDLLVRRKLAIAEARRRGLQNEPKVREALDEIHRNAQVQEEGLLRNALFNSIRLGIEVSEADLREQYEKTKERYVERQWSLRMQGFPNEEAALAANAALGAEGRLDPEQSEATGLVPAEKLPRGVLPILHDLLQPGDRKVIALDRWTIVELEEYQSAAQLPFETVRPKVELSVRALRAEEQLREELDRLRAEMKVEIDEAALAAHVARGAEQAAQAAKAEAGEPAAPAEAPPAAAEAAPAP